MRLDSELDDDVDDDQDDVDIPHGHRHKRSHKDGSTHRGDADNKQTYVRNTRIVVIISRPGLRRGYAPAREFHLAAHVLEALHDSPLEILMQVVQVE